MTRLAFKLPVFYILNYEVNIFAQVFGILALIFLIIAYLNKSKVMFLRFCNISFLFTMFECLVLAAITGFIKPLTGIIRNLICIEYIKRNRKIPKVYNLVFVLLMVVPSMFFIHSYVDVLPVVTSIISTLVTVQGGIIILKSGGAVVQTIMIIYNFLIGAYIGAIRQSIILVSIVVSFVMLLKDRHKTKYEVIE